MVDGSTNGRGRHKLTLKALSKGSRFFGYQWNIRSSTKLNGQQIHVRDPNWLGVKARLCFVWFDYLKVNTNIRFTCIGKKHSQFSSIVLYIIQKAPLVLPNVELLWSSGSVRSPAPIPIPPPLHATKATTTTSLTPSYGGEEESLHEGRWENTDW